MATPRKATEVPAEPEVIEGEPVDTKPPGNLEYLRTAVEQIKKQLRSELNGRIDAVAKSVDDLSAVLVETQSGAGQMLAEDDMSDMVEGRVADGLRAINERFDSLAAQVGDLSNRDHERAARLAAITVAPPAGQVAPVGGVPAILGALWNVMREVTYVPKSGTYDGGSSGTYKFRRFDDVAKELGEAFRRHGIFLRPEVVDDASERFEVVKEYRNGGKSVQNWTDTRLTVSYTLTSLVDGSEQVITVRGEGRDLSDKSTSKAMTMALKTALTQAFMLPTDAPDPDSERPGDEPARENDDDQERREYYSTRDAVPSTSPAGSTEASPTTSGADAPEDRPPDVRAADALRYARQATTQAAVLTILKRANAAGLMPIEVEGQSLQMHLLAIRRTLPES